MLREDCLEPDRKATLRIWCHSDLSDPAHISERTSLTYGRAHLFSLILFTVLWGWSLSQYAFDRSQEETLWTGREYIRGLTEINRHILGGESWAPSALYCFFFYLWNNLLTSTSLLSFSFKIVGEKNVILFLTAFVKCHRFILNYYFHLNIFFLNTIPKLRFLSNVLEMRFCNVGGSCKRRLHRTFLPQRCITQKQKFKENQKKNKMFI